MTASVGVVFLDEQITGEQDAMVQADIAMYDVKVAPVARQGRARARIERAHDHPDQRPRSAESIGRIVRVLHCDDSAPYRRLVAEMLVVQPDLEVVAQAHDGATLLAAAAGCDPTSSCSTPRSTAWTVRCWPSCAPRRRTPAWSCSRAWTPKGRRSGVRDAYVRKSASFDDLSAVLRRTVAR